MRLACQIRPTADLTVMPLLPADATPAQCSVRGGLEGSERLITIVFVDLRGSTTLGEAKLPYDVLFIEEPAVPGNIEVFKRLKQSIDIPLATGERDRTIWEIHQALQKTPDLPRHRRELLRAQFLQLFERDKAFHVRMVNLLEDSPAVQYSIDTTVIEGP